MQDYLTKGQGRGLLSWQDLDGPEDEPGAGLERAASPVSSPWDISTTELPADVLDALDELPRGQREAVRVLVGLDPVDSQGRDAGDESVQRQARRGLDRLRSKLSAG